MRTYVTGATGFIGGRLASSLLASGDEVVVLARAPGKAEALAEAGAEIVVGDITDAPETLAKGMAGVDTVHHLAAIWEVGLEAPELMQRVNVDGTRRILEAAVLAGVPTVVYCSTVAALGATSGDEIGDEDHLTNYAGGFASDYERTKHEAHLVALEAVAAGQAVKIACPTAVYGPGDTSIYASMMKAFVRGLAAYVPFGDARFAFVHVDDVAAGLRLVAEKGAVGREYVIGGQIETLQGMLTIAAQSAGRRPPRGSLPIGVLKAFRPIARPILPRLGMNPGAIDEGLGMMVGRDWAYSSQRAQTELGYRYRSLEEGLPEVVAWAKTVPLATRRPDAAPAA